MKTRIRQFVDHPDRDEMFRALKTGEVPFRKHLAVCSSCRFVYDFLLLNRHGETLDFSAPSLDARHHHGVLPLLVSNWVPSRTEMGNSTHDSWKGLSATVTRDSAMGFERNLHFASGAVRLELVADRTPEGWRFAARCYKSEVPSGEFILKIGKKRILPGLHDCYSWFSPKPPRTIQLLSPSVRLIFETGKW